MKRIICAVMMLALCGCAVPSGDVLAYRANMEKRTFVALSEEAVKASIGYVEEAIKDDSVVSPIGFSLCLGAVGVNSAYPEVALSRLGLSEEGYKPLLDCLNYQDDESALRSTAFAQLIHSDGSLHYVEGRRQQMMEEYGISSIESSVGSYENDALDLMEICLGKRIPLPSLDGADFSTDLALMYSALSLKDSVLEMNSEQLSFHSVDGETLSLEGYAGRRTGEIYLETDSYKALKLVLDNTSLCLFLPDEGEYGSFDLAEAYLRLLNEAELVEADVQVPYFSLETEADLTDQGKAVKEGAGAMAKLFVEPLDSVMTKQRCRFEFDSRGVEGEQVIIDVSIPTSGPPTPAPEPREVVFHADRPFYFVSSFIGIPLFAGLYSGAK